MKKIIVICAVTIAASLHAQTSREPLAPIGPLDNGDCGVETLKGSFALSQSGTRPAAGQPAGTMEQVVGVVLQTYNGDGTFNQVSIEKGSITGLATRSGTGTYNVNLDCSGSATLNIPGVPFPIVSNFVVANHGKELHAFIASPAPVMVSAAGSKQ